MLILKLLRRFQNDEPGAAGGGAPAPAPEPDNTAASAAPAPEPAAEPAAAPAASAAAPEPFEGLTDLLDGIGKPEQPTGAPAAPAAAPAGSTPAASTPAAPAAAPSPAKAPAADELTPPEGMSERAASRWSALTDRVKTIPDLERRATEAEQQLGSVRQLVANSGLDQNEFSDVLALGRQVKSANPKDLEQALQRIDAIRADVATRLGAEVPGVDLLSQHPDLKAQVEGLTLSRDHALEMIRLRTQNASAQRTQQQHTDFEQFQTTVHQAAQRMDTTLQQRAHLPGHEAKVAFIRTYLSDPQRMRQFVDTYQPPQWEAAVLMMYDAYTPPAPAAAPAPSAPQPLRPAQTGAGNKIATAPRNAGDAVNNAFASIGM